MDTKVGFVYVLTNPSIPGQVKIGTTQKRPERRSAELSAATGVPEQFQVAYYRTFEDAPLAENVVHAILEEKGLRVGKNREFFSVSAADAQSLIDEVAQRLEDTEDTEELGQAFVTRAQTLLDSPKPTLGELEEALVLLEHATTLGDPIAPYLGGNTAWDLARRRKGAEAVTLLYQQGRRLFELAAERGAIRGFAQSARMALERDDTSQCIEMWERYLDALPLEEEVPTGELEFILSMLHGEFFSGHKIRPPAHQYLKEHARSLRTRARALGADEAFLRWLDSYVTTLQQRIIERAKVPLIIFAVLVFLFVVKPVFCVMFVAGGCLLFGAGRGARKVSGLVTGRGRKKAG